MDRIGCNPISPSFAPFTRKQKNGPLNWAIICHVWTDPKAETFKFDLTGKTEVKKGV